MARKLWAGLDVGVETTAVCVIDDAGFVLHEASCPTNLKCVQAEIKFLRRRRQARVGLEAGTGTSLARGLRNLGYSIDIYETRTLSKFLSVRRNKTDAGDANGIAQVGRIGASLVPKVHLKSLECQSIACRLKIRRFLIRVRTRGVQVIRRQLELFGARINAQTRSVLLQGQVEGKIKEVFGRTSDPLVGELRHLLDHCLQLMVYQKQLDDDLRRLAQNNDVCRRLMEIPGVGPICALSFYAAIGEPHRFRKSADVGAYLGLTPKVHQSGLTHRIGRISKMGHTETRSLLVSAATRFMRCSEPGVALHAWTRAIEQRSGRLKSRVALARKLATVMIAMWKRGESYDPRPVAKEWEATKSQLTEPSISATLDAHPQLATEPLSARIGAALPT